MTQIIKDKYKDARFRKGHVVTEADIPLLLSMGKEHLYPLVNSLRIAAISAVVVFFAGIAAAYYIAKLPRLVKGVLDVFLTLPLVLPPTVVGYLLLRVLGPKRLIGAWVLETFGIRLVMTWWSAIFATVVVVFPLMYRTVRGAFEAFDETLAYAGQTLGLSNTYIFWHIRMPYCRQGVLAGAVLAFARALGEYGATSMIAGYTPGKTATVSTTVYQLWQINNDELALKWVMVNVGISAIILLVVNMLEKKSLSAEFIGGRPEKEAVRMSLLVDIEKRLGNFMLRSKFEASSGTMALLGASGCGKSVTLRCIAGIMTPDSGRIVLDGETLFDSEKHIDLTPQQRRVALARILASEPRVILLDEPFSALDTFLKWNLELELADLLADFPGPILWVSHDLGECYRNCKTVCVMENGRSGAVTDMQALVLHPATQDAARLAGCRNFLPAHRCAEGVQLDGRALTLPLQAETEQVTIAVPDSAVTLHTGPYSAVVSRVIRDLDASIVLLRPEHQNTPLLRTALPKNAPAEPGQTIRFDLRPEACLCYPSEQA